MLPAVYDDFFAFVLEKATPEEVLAFRPSDAAQARAIELLDKQDEDALTPEEAGELELMRQADELISLLKAKALASLHPK